jgi:signal transduction histidine kinase
LLGSLLCAGGGVVAALVLARGVSRRAAALATNADRLAHGLPPMPLPVGEDEIGLVDARLREAARLLRRRETELRERTRQLETANKELEAFSYSVAHDLRAPLRHMDGFIRLLKKHAWGSLDDRNQRYLGIISDSARQMGLLIDDLLAFSRVGRSELQLRPVSLQQLVQEAMQELREETQERSIDWKIGELPEVMGDRSMMRLVMINLLANAVKFSRSGGTVNVTVGIVGGAARLEVQDAGEGIDASFLPHAFQAFRQDTTRPARAGLGLGLAIARGIIDRHQGTIVVQSAGRDRGTVFSVTLPLGSQEDLTAPAERMPADPDMTSPAHVARGALPEVDRGAEAEPATPQPADGHRRKRARLLQQH